METMTAMKLFGALLVAAECLFIAYLVRVGTQRRGVR
jgi:hypothetical protein